MTVVPLPVFTVTPFAVCASRGDRDTRAGTAYAHWGVVLKKCSFGRGGG